jgi:hypothetical protein
VLLSILPFARNAETLMALDMQYMNGKGWKVMAVMERHALYVHKRIFCTPRPNVLVVHNISFLLAQGTHFFPPPPPPKKIMPENYGA